MNTNKSTNVDWMLDDLVGATGAKYAVVLSTDGLVIQKSANISKDEADALAALASSLSSVTSAVSDRFSGGPVRQTFVEMAQQYLVVTAAGANARLAVIADGEVDLGLVGYEMNRLVKKVGQHLSTAVRNPAAVGMDGGMRS
ncbi:roadblock/LC7 domain-containing protein [Fodinicola acaciae]|uniref:roadblock/LC7 domain-containing protein n=1 Tax=Fodinicola acaciae TaxID=2681555 RepID=UPI0013D89AF3|nr:roadblock/LC7 domain-containing protein [Fodinicola acaciae]